MDIKIKILGDRDKGRRVTKEQFMLDWHKEFSWSGNPFRPEILYPIEDSIAGYDKDRLQINLFVIKKFHFGSIVGPPGSGKTTILRWMEYELKKYKKQVKVQFIPGSRLTGEKQTIKEIIMPVMNPLERFVTKPWQTMTIAKVTNYLKSKLAGSDKRLILLIDDICQASDLALVLLKELFTSDLSFQLIVSGTEEDMKKSDLSVFTQQDHLKIRLSGMKYPDLRKMVKKRIESVGGKDINPISDSLLKRVCKEAEYNPRAVLGFAGNCAAEIALERWHKRLEAEEKARREQEIEERELFEEESAAAESKDEEPKDKKEEALRKETQSEETQGEETKRDRKQGSGRKGQDVGLEDYYSEDVDEHTASARRRRLEQEKKIEDFFDRVKRNLDDGD